MIHIFKKTVERGDRDVHLQIGTESLRSLKKHLFQES